VLDVQDPRNPVVLGDSTYPEVDPIFGNSPAEGNGHAAVFGGDEGQYIWAGDEDFDAFLTTIKDADGGVHQATQGSDVPQVGPTDPAQGTGRYVGLACSPIDPTDDPSDIAVIQRGDCAFTTKAQNAEAAGYQAVIVFNQAVRAGADGCETSISMLVEAGIPALFVPRRFIAEDGSNFWGVHVDELDDGTQIILGSDRNTGLWIFTFTCESRVLNSDGVDTGLYCRRNP
jgi:hypothetical protein